MFVAAHWVASATPEAAFGVVSAPPSARTLVALAEASPGPVNLGAPASAFSRPVGCGRGAAS
eukprot:2780801-Lingulodinium_polyedra.AAC.1